MQPVVYISSSLSHFNLRPSVVHKQSSRSSPTNEATHSSERNVQHIWRISPRTDQRGQPTNAAGTSTSSSHIIYFLRVFRWPLSSSSLMCHTSPINVVGCVHIIRTFQLITRADTRNALLLTQTHTYTHRSPSNRTGVPKHPQPTHPLEDNAQQPPHDRSMR